MDYRSIPRNYRFDVAINMNIIYLRKVRNKLLQFLSEILVNIIVYDMLRLQLEVDEKWVTLYACNGYGSVPIHVCMEEEDIDLWHKYCALFHKMMMDDSFSNIMERHAVYTRNEIGYSNDDTPTPSSGTCHGLFGGDSSSDDTSSD